MVTNLEETTVEITQEVMLTRIQEEVQEDKVLITIQEEDL